MALPEMYLSMLLRVATFNGRQRLIVSNHLILKGELKEKGLVVADHIHIQGYNALCFIFPDLICFCFTCKVVHTVNKVVYRKH